VPKIIKVSKNMTKL